MKTLQGAFKKLALLFVMVLLANQMQAQDWAAGKQIFQENCTSCHALGSVLVGPDLTGVKDRWKDEAKLIAFVRNSQAVINSGDPYAKALYAKFNVIMPPQNLTDEQIKNVLAYEHSGGKDPNLTAGGGGGGAAAESYTPVPGSNNFAKWLFYLIIVLVVVVLLLANRLMNQLNRAEAEVVEEKHRTINWQLLNKFIFPIFGILFFVLTIWGYEETKSYLRPESASEAGIQIDNLFNITFYVTAFVFVVTQILLFWYAFRYSRKEGKKGYYYPHNNTVEFVWTSIPAVVLAILVLYGFKTWNKVTSVPEGANVLNVEAFAKQFSWTFRYPGPDGKLGRTNFMMIDPATNPLGIDFSDPAAKDDYVTNEFHVPVNTTIYMHLRSQDVTHDAYLVHFRIQMYANPGLDNRMQFKPIYTTEQFRKKIGNPDFDYELACNQLCGAGHYNMRRVLVVEEKTAFDKWQGTNKPAYDRVKASATASK